jgi:hypothetical protein
MRNHLKLECESYRDKCMLRLMDRIRWAKQEKAAESRQRRAAKKLEAISLPILKPEPTKSSSDNVVHLAEHSSKTLH